MFLPSPPKCSCAPVVLGDNYAESCPEQKWRGRENPSDCESLFDSGVIRKAAQKEAIKCTAVNLLRPRKYDGEAHEEMRGHLEAAIMG